MAQITFIIAVHSIIIAVSKATYSTCSLPRGCIADGGMVLMLLFFRELDKWKIKGPVLIHAQLTEYEDCPGPEMPHR